MVMVFKDVLNVSKKANLLMSVTKIRKKDVHEEKIQILMTRTSTPAVPEKTFLKMETHPTSQAVRKSYKTISKKCITLTLTTQKIFKNG